MLHFFMMKNTRVSFVGADFERFNKATRRAVFLEEMNRVVPWKRLLALVEPYYPKGESGRVPIRLELMLRIYFLQQWFT